MCVSRGLAISRIIGTDVVAFRNGSITVVANVGDTPVELPSGTVVVSSGPLTDRMLPVDQAVSEDRVTCLCCGRSFKMLKRHLGAEHGMTEAGYRAAFDLPEDFPLVAPSYSRKKAKHARKAGLGKYERSVVTGEA